MGAIVITSISIPTALSHIQHGLEMAIVIVVTTIQPSVASMEAIVITPISIPTALLIHRTLEMAFVMVVTIIQPSVATTEAIVKALMQNIPTALSHIHHSLEMAIVLVVTTIRPSVALMEAIVLVARPRLLVGMFLYEQLHLSFLQFYGCIDSCRMMYE
jgi:hypothetical protein